MLYRLSLGLEVFRLETEGYFHWEAQRIVSSIKSSHDVWVSDGDRAEALGAVD